MPGITEYENPTVFPVVVDTESYCDGTCILCKVGNVYKLDLQPIQLKGNPQRYCHTF